MIFNWFKRNKKSNSTEVDVDDKVILHRHDLSKWNYLGYTNCRYVDEDGKTLVSYPIFLFSSKTNNKRRSFYCSSGANTHNFIEKYIKPWAAGEKDIYTHIQGKDNYPSDYLKEYMLEHYNSEWDTQTNWWGTSDKAKYNSAQNKQKQDRKNKEDKPQVKVEDNVVSVEFGKQS